MLQIFDDLVTIGESLQIISREIQNSKSDYNNALILPFFHIIYCYFQIIPTMLNSTT